MIRQLLYSTMLVFFFLLVVQALTIEARPKRDLQALERIMKEIVEQGTPGSRFRPG